MALHDADSSEAMCSEWDNWSSRCPDKYEQGRCTEKWKSFSKGGGIGLGSLIHWARQDGWSPPKNGKHVPPGKNAHPSGGDDPNPTDVGNAARFIHDHGEDVRHCHPWKTWLTWDGKRWQEDDSGDVVRRAKKTVRNMLSAASASVANPTATKEEKEQAAARIKWALKSEETKHIDGMLKLARCERPVLPNHLDRDPFALNVLNGTLDLRTGQLREHRREDLITKLAPVEYHPDATCPRWLGFLGRIMDGSANLIGYLRRVVGYALTADVREQSLWFFHGTGANGKSTFISTILAMLGDYGMQTVGELLMVKAHEAHPTERADLRGKRFCATIETEEGKRLAEALLKQLTGGDAIRARHMKQDFLNLPRATSCSWRRITSRPSAGPTMRFGEESSWSRSRSRSPTAKKIRPCSTS
jgi:putative DNA primase/helicase